MTAAALASSREGTRGLRRTDPRRDMAGVARVVQIAFAGQLDASGQRMLRDMRLLGAAGWLGHLLGRWLLPPGSSPDGFVWLEGGTVVGNVSLLSVDGAPRRWVMANVAVHPDHRRRGIERALVLAEVSDFPFVVRYRTMNGMLVSDFYEAIKLENQNSGVRIQGTE